MLFIKVISIIQTSRYYMYQMYQAAFQSGVDPAIAIKAYAKLFENAVRLNNQAMISSINMLSSFIPKQDPRPHDRDFVVEDDFTKGDYICNNREICGIQNPNFCIHSGPHDITNDTYKKECASGMMCTELVGINQDKALLNKRCVHKDDL